LALADEHNRYYIATGDLVSTKPEDTVEVHRSFAEPISRTGVDESLANWIARHARPLVLDFE
jgi:hypothetical protein